MFEKKIINYPEYVNIKGTEIILGQMKKSICKINVGHGKIGTGFFCYIPYQYNKTLKVLITNYHIIDDNYIKYNNKINLGINDNEYYINIPLENDRKIYLNINEDLAIIEIKEKDNLNNIKFLELDNRLLNENSKKTYTSENSIYIVHYPNAKEASVSYGIVKDIKKDNFNNYKIIHKCSTEGGSSGSPILNLKTKKVIGVHQGCENVNKNENLGIFLKRPILKLKNEMKTIKEIKNTNYPKYIEDGIYIIIPKHCNNKAIDIDNASNENMANLQLYEFNNTNAQKFEVKYNYEYKYYTIKCLCSNKLLSVDFSNNNIVQYENKNNINQQWYIDKIDNNYIIISKMNGYLMNVDGYGNNLGTNISCKPRTGELNQQFQFKIPPIPAPIPAPIQAPIPPPIPEIKYFQKPSYYGGSIVDALKSIGENSSFDYRALIAKVNGIINSIEEYYPPNKNDSQNIEMLKRLKQGNLKKP